MIHLTITQFDLTKLILSIAFGSYNRILLFASKANNFQLQIQLITGCHLF